MLINHPYDGISTHVAKRPELNKALNNNDQETPFFTSQDKFHMKGLV